MGQLGEDTGPVAGFAVIGHGPTVGVVAEGLQGHLQHLVAAPSLHMGHKADAAGVVLEAGIVQPLLGRQPGGWVNGDGGKVRAGMRERGKSLDLDLAGKSADCSK